jgi:hypothetical protein
MKYFALFSFAYFFIQCASPKEENSTLHHLTVIPTLEKLWESDTTLTGNESVPVWVKCQTMHLMAMVLLPN